MVAKQHITATAAVKCYLPAGNEYLVDGFTRQDEIKYILLKTFYVHSSQPKSHFATTKFWFSNHVRQTLYSVVYEAITSKLVSSDFQLSKRSK